MVHVLKVLGLQRPSILVLITVALITAQLPRVDSRSACFGVGLLPSTPFLL